ncbi:unnamed protein product [Rotaria socialis]|uniref:Uncharacterized protein n=1 Tax=Rotaria socialis TaxID=392032 RepID=A0A818IC30_9BILA|nr:unnamed protein product [Rotaria socialis]
MCHLPRAYEHTFTLVKKNFQTLFNADKNIFICGDIRELHNFCSYNLFTYDQLDLSSINYSECICEECLGFQKNNTWSLQNAVAFELSQWLDKHQTTSSFDIGLDPTLYHFNSAEIEHRQS